jgi:periplasmic protein TonB
LTVRSWDQLFQFAFKKMNGMKILFVCFCFCWLHSTVEAQAGDSILTFVEKMPAFPGEQDSLYSFIGRNIRYPALARENNISGKVVLKFYIDQEGYVRDLSVIKSISPALDIEAMRVMELMNTQGYRWTPGMHEGKIVSVQYVMPINFVLQDVKEDSKKKHKKT